MKLSIDHEFRSESGTEIGNSLEFDFVVPISVVEPTQPLRLARQSKKN